MADDRTTLDEIVATRRRQLQRWIDEHFGGSQAAFIASTNDGTTQVNQGELSGLLRSKSFGEKRARRLEQQAGMPPGYLDDRPATAEDTKVHYAAMEPLPFDKPTQRPIIWPFHLVTYERIVALRRALGARAAQDMIRDVDRYLDVLVTKWEQEAHGRKRKVEPP